MSQSWPSMERLRIRPELEQTGDLLLRSSVPEPIACKSPHQAIPRGSNRVFASRRREIAVIPIARSSSLLECEALTSDQFKNAPDTNSLHVQIIKQSHR